MLSLLLLSSHVLWIQDTQWLLALFELMCEMVLKNGNRKSNRQWRQMLEGGMGGAPFQI